MWKSKKKEQPETIYPSVIAGIKKIYSEKIKPLEQLYSFDEFYSPLLRDSDFDAKPSVLLLGQYSTGKTTFIRYLLERDFPGQNIGPEPTTDKFVAISHGSQDLLTPGNTLAVQADREFRGLNQFGIDFLMKFQGSQCNAEILEDINFIDTPGVLSGEKQRIGRSYDFVSVCEWFAERADLILLLFDAHKLDISDEFKRVIEALTRHSDKIRVCLNKADMVNSQQLMRVYGALMWSLGKVLQTPEVCRVYIGSFWDQPLQHDENAKLFEAEQKDLLSELYSLPRYSAVRKINELVKRARLAKVHAYIISHLKSQMPLMIGKKSKQEELLNDLKNVFFELHKKYRLPVGDFPNIAKFRERLKNYDFNKFPKLNPKLIEAMDQVLGEDIPILLRQFPHENDSKSNPFDLGNPFEEEVIPLPTPSILISKEDREKYNSLFDSLNPLNGKISGKSVREVLVQSNLPRELLSKIWNLSDQDKDGQLSQDEFTIAMHLVKETLSGIPLPDSLPSTIQYY